MNKGIAHILMLRLSTLPYLQLFGGVVSVQEKLDMIQNPEDILPRKVIKKFPVTADFVDTSTGCPLSEGLMDFTPNSRYFGMVYFEDGGTVPTGREGKFDKYTAKLRMVVWLNKTMVNDSNLAPLPAHLTTMAVFADIKSKLKYYLNKNQGYYGRMTVRERNIPIQDKNIFAAYTYDNDNTQFVMPPYEFFAVDYDIDFRVNPDCLAALAVSLANLECSPHTSPVPAQYPTLDALQPYQVVLQVGIDTDTGFIVTPHPDKLKLNEVEIVSEVSVGNIDIQNVTLANDGTAFDFTASAGEVTSGTITLTVKKKNYPQLDVLMPYQVKLIVGIDTNTGAIITPNPDRLELDKVEVLSDIVIGNIPYQNVPLTNNNTAWDFTDTAGEVNSGVITLTVRKKIV